MNDHTPAETPGTSAADLDALEDMLAHPGLQGGACDTVRALIAEVRRLRGAVAPAAAAPTLDDLTAAIRIGRTCGGTALALRAERHEYDRRGDLHGWRVVCSACEGGHWFSVADVERAAEALPIGGG